MTVAGDRLLAFTAGNQNKLKKANCHTFTSQHSPDARPSDRPSAVGFNKARGAGETEEPQCERTHSIGPNVAPYSNLQKKEDTHRCVWHRMTTFCLFHCPRWAAVCSGASLTSALRWEWKKKCKANNAFKDRRRTRAHGVVEIAAYDEDDDKTLDKM